MIPWELVGSARVPGGGDALRLYRRGAEFSLRLANIELMNSRGHGSEGALARLACEKLGDREAAKVLVGGLGMGFTLRAVLDALGPDSKVTVAELVPEVLEWNRGALGGLNNHPVRDKRVTVVEGDVAGLLGGGSSFHAILLDVDNGPEGLTQENNAWLYSVSGLAAASASLKSGGVLAVWSVHPSPAFTRRLDGAGFSVTEERVRAHGKRGARHTIWLAKKV